MSKVIGIDLGTATTLIYIAGKGIVLREPSIVAMDERNGQVLARSVADIKNTRMNLRSAARPNRGQK